MNDMAESYLKDAIVDFLRKAPTHQNIDDIVEYFQLRADITIGAVNELQTEGRIVRVNVLLDGWNGHHYYEVKRS